MRLYRTLAAVMAAAAGIAISTAATGETWKPIGTGLLRDDMLTTHYALDSFWEFDVEIEESEQTPGRYRLVNAYRNCPKIVWDTEFPEDAVNYLVVDASDPEHCFIELGGTSYWVGKDGDSYQQMVIGSMADDYYNNRYGDWEKADEEGICGTLEDGTVTFPRLSLTIQGYLGSEFRTGDLDYDNGCTLGNRSGMFRLRLPGTPDTDVDINMRGADEGFTGVVYDISFSDDLEYVLLGVLEGEYDPSMADRIMAGEVETGRLDTPGEYVAPFGKNGIYTLVAVPYAGGRPWEASYLTREWTFSQDEWKVAGKAVYTEGILSSNETFDYNGIHYEACSYEVEVRQNVEFPWLIRLTDPYGPGMYPLANDMNYDSSRQHCLTFDMGDFKNVRLLREDNIGLDLNNGDMGVWSYADRVINDPDFSEDLADSLFPGGVPTGRYDESLRTVNFDKNAFCIYFSLNPMRTWYAANRKGEARLVLPDGIVVPEKPGAGICNPEIPQEPGAAEYYTAGGSRVSSVNLAPGVYIVREGNETRKILIGK